VHEWECVCILNIHVCVKWVRLVGVCVFVFACLGVGVRWL
jgi:hypothetical protein